MVDLVAKSPADGLLPVEYPGTSLVEHTPMAITWLAPFQGQNALVDERLHAQTGCRLPDPNRISASGTVRSLSTAPGEALVIGASLDIEGAACADQSDGWTVLHLSGAQAREVLTRVTPIDIRPHAFEVNHTARTFVGHMTASLSRLEEELWEILVFRSMAKTAVHDLSRAMKAVAARHAL